MELDAKHKVLFALYAEYLKDLPDMPSITFERLNMSWDIFYIALLKLQNEGFIDGLKTFPPNTRMLPKAVNLDSVMMTRYGLEYVEQKLEIERMSTSQEKLRQLKDKFGKFGWAVLQNVAVNILTKFFE
ncbi:MAG: hypothetical protein II870_01990 [Synergistaceae bacterium]|nr:hypothetical protein [Synergistaceae bacterium]MBQ6740575.1 hypothetical protein [Synergistaceae bacterium]MBR0045201.1 hypothetical protein [Synergistaceae bacterium]MBR0096848.1 hypothetical protein [Synergistaceae bacterium]